MMSSEFQPIPPGTLHASFLARNGLPPEWPQYYATQLYSRVYGEVRAGGLPPEQYDANMTPTPGYASQLVSWANSLRRGGVGAADLSDPESIATGSAVASELAYQSTAAETIHAIAKTQQMAANQRRARIRMSQTDPALHPRTNVLLQWLNTAEETHQSTYETVMHAARYLANQRQAPVGSPTRTEATLYDSIGFALPETSLTPLVQAELHPVAAGHRFQSSADPEARHEQRIAHYDQAHTMALCGSTLEYVLRTANHRYQTAAALGAASTEAATHMEKYYTLRETHIYTAQQKVIDAYRTASHHQTHDWGVLVETLEAAVDERYQTARTHIAYGNDDKALGYFRDADAPLLAFLTEPS